MAIGVTSYGTHVPYHRLPRSAIAAVLGGAPARGARAVASYDENATTMAVEAGRVALARRAAAAAPQILYFATTAPPYLDKANATTIHAALDLDQAVLAADMVGSVRSASAVLRAAIDAAHAGRSCLALLADVRGGLPGGADEREGGDGAAALLFGSGDEVLAEVRSFESASHEHLDRWRLPGEQASRVWEERFAEQVLLPLAESAVKDACKAAGIAPDAFDHVIVAGTHARAVKAAPKAIGVRATAVVPSLDDVIGNTGTAHAALLLAAALDRAAPGESILVVNLADGADAMVLAATEALLPFRERSSSPRAWRTLAEQLTSASTSLPYASFLTWRGVLPREPPRRPDPDRPAAPPSMRRGAWKFAFVGSRCGSCGTRHLPPQLVCFECGASDSMTPESMADVPATVSMFTVDRLAYSPSPPLVAVVIDFAGGGRYHCELTDVGDAEVRVGMPVEMTFRRLFTAGGVHNYFWKARPAAPLEGN